MNEDPTHKLPNSQDGTLAQILNAVQNLSNRVEGLERKVDERLYDTRPIWEKVQADIAQLQEGQKSLSEGQASLSESQTGLAAGQQRLEDRQQRFDERLEGLRDEMRTGFRDLKRQFSVLNDTFLEARADYKDLDKRVYQLEGERT